MDPNDTLRVLTRLAYTKSSALATLAQLQWLPMGLERCDQIPHFTARKRRRRAGRKGKAGSQAVEQISCRSIWVDQDRKGLARVRKDSCRWSWRSNREM